MAQKKKKSNSKAQPQSKESFIREKARSFPLSNCYISSEDWSPYPRNVIITRERSNSNKMVGIFTIDPLCCGLIKSDVLISVTPDELERKLEPITSESISNQPLGYDSITYEEAHNYIFGAIEFGREGGIEPDIAFSVTKYMLEPDDDQIPVIDYEYGYEGRHIFLQDIYDHSGFLNTEHTIKKLGQYLGVNFRISTTSDFKFKINSSEPYSLTTGPFPDELSLTNALLEQTLLSPTQTRLSNTAIAAIVALPRRSLIEDLHNATLWAIGILHRDTPCSLRHNARYILRHVMAILIQIKDPAAQSIVIDAMRESDEITQYYFGEWASDLLGAALLYTTDASNLSVLEDFIFTPGVFTWRRIDGLSTLMDLEILYPELKEHINNIIHRYLDHIAENLASKTACDSLTASVLMEILYQIGQPDMEPVIRKIFSTGQLKEFSGKSCEDLIRHIKAGVVPIGSGYCRTAEEIYDILPD